MCHTAIILDGGVANLPGSKFSGDVANCTLPERCAKSVQFDCLFSLIINTKVRNFIFCTPQCNQKKPEEIPQFGKRRIRWQLPSCFYVPRRGTTAGHDGMRRTAE